METLELSPILTHSRVKRL